MDSAHMDCARVLVARMGQMRTTSTGDTLKAIMGSCVGVGILWEKHGIYALSHCLLGSSPNGSGTLNAKYVSDAIPMMLQAMKVENRRDLRQLQAVVVGGGNMLQETGNPGGEEIGPSNIDAAETYLNKNRVPIQHLQCAEGNASQLFIHGASGDYEIILIPKLVVDNTKTRRKLER